MFVKLCLRGKKLMSLVVALCILTGGIAVGNIALAGSTTSTSTNDISCGGEKVCPTGFVCIGETFDASNTTKATGTCRQNALTSVICKMTGYITSKIGRTFMLFALVMMGLAFFLGKISWGMIMTVILGSALMLGADSIMKALLSDSDSDYCGTKVTMDTSCKASSYENIGDPLKNESKIYNTMAITNSPYNECKTLLGCVQFNCNFKVYKDGTTCKIVDGTSIVWMPNGQDSASYIPKVSSALSCTAPSLSNTAGCDKEDQSKNQGKNCCVTIQNSEKRDYWKCKNGCVASSDPNSEIVIETYSYEEYKDCADVMRKMGIAEF
jgi:type IV secretory pathway VirB2 component (pilin)